MSLLNKFIAPELKIQSKSARGSKNNLKTPKIIKAEIAAATSKGAMTLRNVSSIKTQTTIQSLPNTGGGGKK